MGHDLSLFLMILTAALLIMFAIFDFICDCPNDRSVKIYVNARFWVQLISTFILLWIASDTAYNKKPCPQYEQLDKPVYILK